MASKTISDQSLIDELTLKYGAKSPAMYYLRKAKDAAARARVALASQNPYALGAEAQTMITNVEMVYKLLGGDDASVEDSPKTIR